MLRTMRIAVSMATQRSCLRFPRTLPLGHQQKSDNVVRASPGAEYNPANYKNRNNENEEETDEEFDDRYVCYFKDPCIDGWWIRKHWQDLQGMDMVPEPRIINEAMRACRRVNDYALAVRILEAAHHKCGPAAAKLWPYIVQEIKPTCRELGILLPEEMGYHKAELWLESTCEM